MIQGMRGEHGRRTESAQGMATLNKVVDTTLKMKFVDAMRYFEAAAEEYKALGMCT